MMAVKRRSAPILTVLAHVVNQAVHHQIIIEVIFGFVVSLQCHVEANNSFTLLFGPSSDHHHPR